MEEEVDQNQPPPPQPVERMQQEVADDDVSVSSPPPPRLSEAESRQLQEQAALVVDAQLRAMAVSKTTSGHHQGGSTPSPLPGSRRSVGPASTATSTGTRSAGESIDDHYATDRLKPFVRTCRKFESGSGSCGDQDGGMISMEDGMDVAAKKRKTRRGKPKHRNKLKPYSKQHPSYQQRLRCRASGRSAKTGRQPPAPYNTTQFLMEDHNDLPDLDEKLAGSTAVAAMAAEVHSHFSKPSGGAGAPPPRTRDSSFSVDSGEDYFYSSPEDEEEFLTKEFSSAYEDLHAERLGALTKAELIQEYIQLEAKQRVDELLQQNEQLRRENEMLRKQRHGSPTSSVDSESDSESNSSSEDDASECSCNHKTCSPGSSPVPASYHAPRRDNAASNRRKNSSVSSLDGETDYTTGGSDVSPMVSRAAMPTTTTTSTNIVAPATLTTTSNGTSSSSSDLQANGHAAGFEIVALPT
ncbi:hypothetical protein QAD02_001695 [Eretmocerus hayati]|uniref:Uncharacterized protein n=1 Tax=Eretmocerus hayati TaxID=131215 RepID=A0ACC2NII0_9HYME|nr:hypothetical protein QAD02_001695 [Eretmocerus hayati]